MTTYLPQNKFMDSAPARTSPDADEAGASTPAPAIDASAALLKGRMLENPPSPFLINSNSAMPTAESGGAFSDPSGSAAPPAPFQSSCGDRGGYHGPIDQAKPVLQTSDTGVAPGPQDYEPSMTNGGDQEAPAGRAPNTVAPAGAFGVIDCIHEIFHYARKLMKDDPRFVLDEVAFMAAIDETPLFVREADGYLRRNA